MIYHLKYTFTWIFVLPQPTDNVFVWDFVQIFLVFTFIRIGARSIHLVMYFT